MKHVALPFILAFKNEKVNKSSSNYTFFAV